MGLNDPWDYPFEIIALPQVKILRGINSMVIRDPLVDSIEIIVFQTSKTIAKE